MKLALGCGNNVQYYRRRGFLTLDAVRPRMTNPDIIAEVPPLPEDVLKHGQVFDEVEAMHFWEHLYAWQAEALAREIVGILVPGEGKLVMEMPNLERAIEHFVNGAKDPRMTMWAVYGAQTDPKWHGNPYAAHKWGYTPETIEQQLLEAGFRGVHVGRALERMPVIRDMRVIAYV